ncbi:MAG TPA: HAMP domain-containing sensor histidine kinase [Candidatus Thermoplasmatota archaeon]|nr:HAMP domain-containing sensor histidine kinase [Candidatus Thermoplasmatota archaeon]
MTPSTVGYGLRPRRTLDEVDARLRTLLGVMARVAARDFSEKPTIAEGDDALAQFTTGFRFMIEDLERAHADLDREREELRRANVRLKALDQAKTHLINSAAHELGTPLTPIKFQLHLLKEKASHPEFAAFRPGIEMVDRNIGRLEVLVRDMLDVARLESGKLVLKLERTDLVALVREVAETFEPAARQAGLTLALDVPAELYGQIDEKRIVQVLFNFVSNAIKFTPAGGRITVALVQRGQDAEFTVSDTGVGIERYEAERLFQPFSQLQDPLRSRSGAGLGLYISRGLVERHQGRIWCKSDGRDRGSTFGFSLPCL